MTLYRLDSAGSLVEVGTPQPSAPASAGEPHWHVVMDTNSFGPFDQRTADRIARNCWIKRPDATIYVEPCTQDCRRW